MKFKALTASLALGFSIVSTPMVWAEQVSDAQLADVISRSSVSVQELVQALIAQYPDMVDTVVEAVIAARPEAAADVVSAAVKAAPASAESIIRTALSVAPEAIGSIVQAAQAANIPNATVTQAAIQAGLDPTQVAQATAAGVPSAPPPPATAPISVSGS